VVGDELGVVANAVDEAGIAPVLEAQPEHVQARNRGHSAPVPDLARFVEDGYS
jgi:hypothetical protein